MWQTLDVTKESEWKSAITSIESKLGPLDVACLNAGWAGGPVGAVASLDKIDIDSYRRIVDINEIGVVLGLKYSAESMARNNAEEWKAIVTTSSIAGFTAEPGIPIGCGYFPRLFEDIHLSLNKSDTGTKFAVRGITKAAAQLGGPLRIRVNSIVSVEPCSPDQTHF